MQVVHDVPGIGKNLHDHLYVESRFEIAEPLTLVGLSEAAAESAQRLYLEKGEGPFATNYIETGAFLRCDPASEYADIQLHFTTVFGVSYYDGAPPDRHGVSFTMNVCRPRSRGELRLNSADPLDKPLIDPRYLSDRIDLDLAIKGVRKSMEIGNAAAFATVGARQIFPAPEARSDEGIIDYIRRAGNTVWHPVGTCKMGSDPMAVVDDRLRVHGLAGLRVADASIMPTIVSGNTNAPCIMIGEKLSDLVLAA